MTHFPAVLTAAREKSGLSIQDLAVRTGLAGQTIRYYESGEREPKWTSICKLATALGISTEAFRVK